MHFGNFLNIDGSIYFILFFKLLFALAGTYRYDGEEINTELANTEAKILNDAITKGQFNDNEIIRILSTRSKAQLNTTFNCYKDTQNRSITKVCQRSSCSSYHWKSFCVIYVFFFFRLCRLRLQMILQLLFVRQSDA